MSGNITTWISRLTSFNGFTQTVDYIDDKIGGQGNVNHNLKSETISYIVVFLVFVTAVVLLINAFKKIKIVPIVLGLLGCALAIFSVEYMKKDINNVLHISDLNVGVGAYVIIIVFFVCALEGALEYKNVNFRFGRSSRVKGESGYVKYQKSIMNYRFGQSPRVMGESGDFKLQSNIPMVSKEVQCFQTNDGKTDNGLMKSGKWYEKNIDSEGNNGHRGAWFWLQGEKATGYRDYSIGGEYNSLKGKILLADSARNTNVVFTFRFYADGSLIFTSAPLTGGTKPFEVEMSVSGAKILRIECSGQNGNNNKGDFIICGFVDAEFKK